MPDPYRKVQPGADVVFSAAAWNAMLGAGRDWQARQLGRDSGDLTTTRDAALVRVRNDTGGPIERYSVLGLDGPIFTPSDSENAALQEVTFRGVAPSLSDHVGKFCVTLAAAVEDQVVRAFVAGVTWVRVDVADPEYRRADVADLETGHLAQSGVGTAQVLWLEADGAYYGYDTGVQWAVVRLGCAPVPGLAYASANIAKLLYGVAGSGNGVVARLDDTDNLVSTGVPIVLKNLSTEKQVNAGAPVQYKPVEGKNRAVIDWADCGDLG